MATSSIDFIVPGQEQPVEAGATRGATATPLASGLTRGRLKQSVRVGAQRGAGGEVRVSAVPGEDVVVLHIAGGPVLTLHPESARDLMLAQEAGRSRGSRGEEPQSLNEVRVPTQLRWRGLEEAAPARAATRGLGGVLLTAIEVVTGVASGPAAEFAADKIVERFDDHVQAGVYGLNPENLPALKNGGALVASVPPAPAGAPLLILVHGTFSDTPGTFGKLWKQHPQRVRALFKYYKDRVYALDHPTLGASPIANALTLAKALPAGERLHLLTHSRGGLVAEALARVCADPDGAPEAFASLDDVQDAGYARQRTDLSALAAEVKARDIKVERIVRVACPVRGTLLASKRLDAYLSVLKWTLELAAIQVAPALVEFLGEIAQYRTDPAKIPGLAAQMPGSPLVRWLHAANGSVPGELRVVAGDLEGDSVTTWLKTLLADAYYWTDNDLVVQTRSMYGGMPRAGGATFLFDQGGRVTHFNYFSNERTAAGIVDALTAEKPQGFRIIGPLSWAGEAAEGTRAGQAADDGTKPALFMLPGILGSNLKADGERIWVSLHLVNRLKRLDYVQGRADGVEPDGPIEEFYDDLMTFLSSTHQVIPFAYDWRKPLEDEARRFAAAVDAALAARAESRQPVRIIAHSMGGLLARVMQLECPDVWGRLMAHSDARMLMLGTPNGGSWAPMQVLSGDDAFGNLLVSVGAPFEDHQARMLMARLPGFIQLQAGLLDATHSLGLESTWQQLAKDDLDRLRQYNQWHSEDFQFNVYQWGIPPQDILDRAVALRGRLDAQRDGVLPQFHDKLLLVVGKAQFTPDGYETGEKGLFYLDAQDGGDGRVTLQSALLPGVRAWQLDCKHDKLPDLAAAFKAYDELLQNGSTLNEILKPLSDASRGAPAFAPAHVVSRPSRTPGLKQPPQSKQELLSPAADEEIPAPARGAALQVTVINGDLTFVRQPLLLGHYRSERLTGTEFAMNRLIGGMMQDSLRAGLYPDAPGTHQVFVNRNTDAENPWRMPRPEAVIVVGLGEEGKLRGTDLVHSVRRAVIAWALRATETSSGVPIEQEFELAATLIGSGGIGMTPGQSAQLIAQGVREANERLAGGGGEDFRPFPQVGRLYLVELYLDRAGEAWRALQAQATAAPAQYRVIGEIQPGVGALTRPLDSDYRGADYDFISAVTGAGDDRIVYSVDTKRARSEVRAQQMQAPLLRQLVAKASNDLNRDPQIGRTLFQLLVPIELEPFLGSATDIVIEVDGGTAGIPWELLDTSGSGGGDRRPWAIRSKLLRKLRTADFREQVRDATPEASMLVIGEPLCDPAVYPRLPGARAEAVAVAESLTTGVARADRMKQLVSDSPGKPGPDARAVINALMERDWRIVHIAGHGEPPQPGGDPRGVVLSDGAFLGPREIRSMRVVPELVFVNCCYLGARDTAQVLAKDDTGRGGPYDRSRFAAGVAEALIMIGVRCVIAAGWAVEDKPAKDFATTFYRALLDNKRFIDAVAEAREASRAPGSNTWAAYQCYGDPDWYLRREGVDPQRPTRSAADEFAGVASQTGLVLALNTLEVQSNYQKAPAEEQRAKLRHLEERFARSWGATGRIAEAFGAAWAAARGPAQAIQWYEKALAANDGTASLRTIEQLGNLRARQAWTKAGGAQQGSGEHAPQSGAPASRRRRGRTKQNPRAAGPAGMPRAALDGARVDLMDALAMLERIAGIQPTVERNSLCGSVWKRKALLETIAKNSTGETEALAKMREYYEKAEKLAREAGQPDLFYPALNRMAAELIVNGAKGGWKGFERASTAEVRKTLSDKMRDDPDFWSAVGLIELRLYEALARRNLAAARASIEAEYEELRERVSAAWMWASVYDQLRFVLPRYAERASQTEKAAVAALLKRIVG